MLPYFPALRGKPGEFAACGHLPRRYQAYICPRFVVPPPNEPDPEKGRIPAPDEIARLVGERLGKSWPILPAFLDPQLAATVLGDEGVATLFRMAYAVNGNLIPVFTVHDLQNPARRQLLRNGAVRAGIYLDFESADPKTILEGLRAMELRPEQCTLFVDFTGAVLGKEFAPAIAAILDRLGEAARWSKIVYQASAYPEKIPAKANAQARIPRSEWTTFLTVLQETSVEPRRLAYGDFGADCGRMTFPGGKGGGIPRPHLRYTGEAETLVVRGSDTGSFTPTMRGVCRTIIESPEYAGRSFSPADDRIWRNAKDLTDSCGDATAWRALNMEHHFVRVIRDLGAMAGVTFEDESVDEYAEQGSLF